MQLLELHQDKKLAGRGAARCVPTTAGESELSDYQYGKKTAHHLFCKRCGVSSFEWGQDKNLGGSFMPSKSHVLTQPSTSS